MDDRTIIDDDSTRITDPMKAKPGDLMVLGCMDGCVFKQKAWVVVTAVEDYRNSTDTGVCVDVNHIEFYVDQKSDREHNELCLVTEDSLESTGLYFDCLIRPKQHHKRGIYKDKNDDFVYFDGNKFFFCFHLFKSSTNPLLVSSKDMNWNGMTLVYPFDEDDDHGEKNI